MQIPSLKHFMPNLSGVFFDDHALGIYYSYTTIIGYVYKGDIVLSSDDWCCRLTARHINYLDIDKNASRIPQDQLLKQLQEILDNIQNGVA